MTREHPLLGRNSWKLQTDNADLRRRTPAAAPIQVDAKPTAITLDTTRTALLVIDMQNDFCHPQGWLAGIGVDISGAQRPIPVLEGLLPRCRAASIPIVWVSWGNREDQANLPPGVRHVYDPAGHGDGIGSLNNPAQSPVLTSGSWAAAVVDALAVDDEDILVEKYRMSGFVDTPLDSILRNLRVDSLLFAGVNADQCVLATLMDAANIGYDVVLVEDAVGTTSPAYCLDATLYNVRQCFGFTTTSAALASELVTSGPSGAASL